MSGDGTDSQAFSDGREEYGDYGVTPTVNDLQAEVERLRTQLAECEKGMDELILKRPPAQLAEQEGERVEMIAAAICWQDGYAGTNWTEIHPRLQETYRDVAKSFLSQDNR